jgi:hypothetical protein
MSIDGDSAKILSSSRGLRFSRSAHLLKWNEGFLDLGSFIVCDGGVIPILPQFGYDEEVKRFGPGRKLIRVFEVLASTHFNQVCSSSSVFYLYEKDLD